MTWTFNGALESFERHRERWDEINRRQGSHVLLDSSFVWPLIRHFASKETLLGVCDDASNPAAVLVARNRVGFWETFQPSQAPVGLALFGDADAGTVSRQIRDLMRSLPGYAVGFSILQQDPDFSLGRLNGALAAEKIDYIQTSRFAVPPDWQQYWRSRSKNLTHNLSRQRRRLEEKGSKVRLVAETRPEAVSEAIEMYGKLESSGWKSEEGTAVAAENQQGLFYRDIMKDFCARSEGVIYRLLIDDKTVASDLCLVRGKRMVILKTAYDESVQGLSLGMLMHEDIFKALSGDGIANVVEFYGRVRDWHLKWTDEVRTMFHVNFYRHAWVPVARRAWKAWRKG